MFIAHNLLAINANRQLNINCNAKANSTEKLSSGYRINRAADDAAGLSISEKMRAQIRGLNKGSDNVQDGISLIKTADGALNEVHDILHRMNELAVQAANDTNTTSDREALQKELNSLSEEITRIGLTTTFNTMKIFDNAFDDDSSTITQLISCPSADYGFLSEAIQVGSHWLPSSTLDFSGVNSNNISLLDGKGFSFHCCRGCEETFDFKFATDGTPDSATNLNGKVKHEYVIDISNCQNGSDIIDKIYSYVSNNLPTSTDMDTVNKLSGVLAVSHSNYMLKTDDGNGLIIYASRRIEYNSGTGSPTFSAIGYATEEAKKAYPPGAGINSWAGAIDCSSLVSLYDVKENVFNIQCSSDEDNKLQVGIKRMNAILLGVDSLNITNGFSAGKAITKIKKATEEISSQRGSLGAYQNRLEHTYSNNMNASENTQAAETRIRDADMAKEMLKYSIHNILDQAGNSMLTQANATTQGILTLIN